jgi:predicted Zn finger-like uncharacterized protein
MHVICSKCKTRLRISDERIKPEGSKFKCSKCGVVLLARKLSSTIKKEPGVNASDGIKPGEAIEPSYSKSGLSLKAQESEEEEDETTSEETPPSPPPIRSYWAGTPPGREEDANTRPFLHRLPDAFAYPIKGSGFVLILVGTVCFSFLDFFASLSVFGFIATAFVAGYLCAFMMKIVNSSADGKKELPDWPDASDFWDDIIVPLFQVIWTGIFCFAPAIIYLIFVHFDIFFWLLIALGILYFPMALIAVALTNSLLSINPVLIVPSIIKVPVDYLAACAILALIALLANFSQLLVSIIPLAGLVLKNLLGLYFLVVEAHVLGLIYHANQEKLGWFGEGEK